MRQARPAKITLSDADDGQVASIRTRPGKSKKTQSVVADALRNAALDLFASQNYSSVTIKDISEATGVNASLIYYYFGSKEDLFLDIVETTVEGAFTKFESVTTDGASPEGVIASWLETHITQFVLLQKLAKMSLDYASAHSRSPRLDKAIRKFYDREAVVLKAAVQAGIEQGVFRAVDPGDLAVFISTFLDGVLFRSVMFPKLNHKAVIGQMRALVLQYVKV